MENDSRFQQWLNSVTEWLNEQEWFGQLKAKWEELEPQNRVYVKAGGVVGGLLFLMMLVLSAVWSVHSLKNELADKTALVASIQSANDEMRRLKDETAGSAAASAGAAAGGGGTWTSYFENVGNTVGVDKTSLTVSGDRAGAVTDQAKESLYDLSLKHVSIKQVVRYAFGVENGSRPVKLRNLSIDTHADPQGYMDATLAVSAFALITK
jgi:hypothetical protein